MHDLCVRGTQELMSNELTKDHFDEQMAVTRRHFDEKTEETKRHIGVLTEETKHHMGVLTEELTKEIQTVAELITSNSERLDRIEKAVDSEERAKLDDRVRALEEKIIPPEKAVA